MTLQNLLAYLLTLLADEYLIRIRRCLRKTFPLMSPKQESPIRDVMSLPHSGHSKISLLCCLLTFWLSLLSEFTILLHCVLLCAASSHRFCMLIPYKVSWKISLYLFELSFRFPLTVCKLKLKKIFWYLGGFLVSCIRDQPILSGI